MGHLPSRARLITLFVTCVALTGVGSAIALITSRASDGASWWRAIAIATLAGFPGLLLAIIAMQRSDDRRKSDRSMRVLERRAQRVDQLLEFSQTAQAAGRSDQIFATLCHFLQQELGLTGVAMLAHESDSLPAVQLKAAKPDNLVLPTLPVAELDTTMCPCLRQNLPRQFRCDGSPVRCSIDQHLSLPATHPAYCIPIRIGQKTQVVIHMLLPPEDAWTEDRCQLAQTYANTAQSALISLQLLTEAEQRSMTDPLTGLYNRRSMEQLMEREVAMAERHKRPLSLVMIDLDLFKQINDAHGHAAGDHLLHAFADCVRMTLRKTDLAFRYGGDEFAIALPLTPVSQAQQVVQKLRQAFASVDFSSAIAHLDQQPTLSIGLAERSEAYNILSAEALLAAADQALYDAKTANRNCIRTYQPPKAA